MTSQHRLRLFPFVVMTSMVLATVFSVRLSAQVPRPGSRLIVAAPPDITVGITTDTGAKGSDDDDLADFLAGSHAQDALDVAPTFLGAQVNGAYIDNGYEFVIGVTPVTFWWKSRLGATASATAAVTVLDHLKKGDLLVGESFPPYGPWGPSVGRIERVRNGLAAPFCETPWDSFDPMFWDGPSDLIVDSKGAVIFLASGRGGLRMLRCTRPGAAVELIADFASRAVDAPPTASIPFPKYGFRDPSTGYFHYSGLHLAKRTLLKVDADPNSGRATIADDETYNFQAGFFELHTSGPQVKTFVYHVATGQWDTDGPAGVVYPNASQTGHMFFNAGTTYAVFSNIIRGVVDPFQIDVGLKIGSVFSGKLSLMLGGGVKQYDNLVMNDVNVPDVALPPGLCGGALVPMRGGGFAGLSGMHGVAYDTWGSLGLVTISDYGPAAPFLTNMDEGIFKPNGAPAYFPQPYANCNPTPQIMFSAPLPFYSPTTGHSNSVDRIASTSVGLVGTRFWGNDIVKIPAAGGDEVETVVSVWHPMGIAGFPAKIKGAYGVAVGMSIQSPVNILMTDTQGRRIGTDLATGDPVNDFGANGVDSGPGTEPRYFFVLDPAPGGYTVQTIGTGDGPYTVDVYSADTRTRLGGRLTHTGTAAIGSLASHDFTLGENAGVAFVSAANSAPTADAGPDQDLEATSAAGATVHLDGSASSDPDGDTLTFAWSGAFGTASGAAPAVVMPLGVHTIALTVDDGHDGAATTATHVTVRDTTPPAVHVPDDQTLEATGSMGAPLSFSVSATDIVDGTDGVTCSALSGSTFPIGTSAVNCTAVDRAGNAGSARFNVTVRDTTPPKIASVGTSQRSLWPPNKKMIPIVVTVSASDAVTAAPVCRIDNVASNEPGSDQWQVSSALALMLRADRLGTGTGRIYTIGVTCIDAAGNTSPRSTTTVTVPHDRGK